MTTTLTVTSNAYINGTIETLSDIKLAVIGYLSYKIPDPNSSRTTQWVCPATPDVDMVRPVLCVSSPSEVVSNDANVGNVSAYEQYYLDIEAFVDSVTSGNVNSVSYIGAELIDRLMDEVSSQMKRSRSYLKTNYGIVDVKLMERTPTDYDEQMDNYKQRSRFLIQIEFVR